MISRTLLWLWGGVGLGFFFHVEDLDAIAISRPEMDFAFKDGLRIKNGERG